MSIQSRRILGDPLASGSSGDGASQDRPTDPNTGAPISGYRPPTSSARQSSGINYAADAETNARYHAARIAAGGGNTSDATPSVRNAEPGGVDEGLGGYGKAIG